MTETHLAFTVTVNEILVEHISLGFKMECHTHIS